MTTSVEYALMAGASYIDTRRLVNQFPAPGGWAMSNHKSKDSGFEAVTFTKGTEIVISFAGTNPNSLLDPQTKGVSSQTKGVKTKGVSFEYLFEGQPCLVAHALN
jgi:hypothetical protein